MRKGDIILFFKKPQKNDGKFIYNLVNKVGTLDVNSEYLYLLQSTHFNDTCIIVKDNEKIIGFVSGYILPNTTNTLFIWQVAVDSDYRGQNIAKRMVCEMLQRDELNGIEYIYSTVSPSNSASQRVFKKIADEYDTKLVNETFLEVNDFNNAHEDEVLYKIGPINKKTKGNR